MIASISSSSSRLAAVVVLTLTAVVVTDAALNFTRSLRILSPAIDQTVKPLANVVKNVTNAAVSGNLTDLAAESKTFQCIIPVTDIDAKAVQPDIYFFTSTNSDNNGEHNYDEKFLFNATGQQLRQAKFNSKWHTYFLVHGFMASWKDDPWMVETKDLIFNKTKHANVFLVDWSKCSKPLIPGNYPKSVACTHVIGDQLAQFVTTMIKTLSVKPEHIEFIGHSLGSHISGFVGQNIEGNLGRITGLDPAGPCFGMIGTTSNNLRLSRGDAIIVTALHTNANTFGINENVADFDIYINGGDAQPGCPTLKNKFNELITFQLSDFLSDLSLTCSHSYSHDLITPDLGQCQSVAYRCKSYRLYRLGECGHCNANNNNCHLSGLTVQSDEPPNTFYTLAPEEQSLLQRGYQRQQLQSAAADNCTNNTLIDKGDDYVDLSEEFDEYDLVKRDGKENATTNNNSTRQSSSSATPLENDHNEHNEQRYYVRTASDSPYCCKYIHYHYAMYNGHYTHTHLLVLNFNGQVMQLMHN